MNCWKRFSLLAALALIPLITPSGRADQALDRLEKQRCRPPAEFVSVFSFGYAGDAMPRDNDKFEQLLLRLKEGGFNVIHCTYTDQRLALCKKHGMLMMIDLLAPEHHVYKSPEKAQALCEKLRDNPTVWGYNIWNDTFAKTVAGRRRDINTVRKWDSTHPAYSGTYRTQGMRSLVNADVLGYYDFHWKRGTDQHFPHLLAYLGWAKERNACFYTWLSASSGQAGKGNFNRSLYSANTGIACGLKGILWFLGGDLMSPATQKWTEAGQDILKVNKAIMPLRKELAKIGLPTAVYSTPITRTLNDRPLAGDRKEAMTPGLADRAFPKDFWIQPVSGEFVLGVFKDDQKRDAVFVANHNAYAEQKVTLKLTRPVGVQLFQRAEGKWQTLPVKEGAVSFTLEPGGGELLRFGS